MQFIVFMLFVFRAHFSPVKFSTTIFLNMAKPLASYTLGGSEKYTWPILLICIVDKSLCEACLVSFRLFIFVI